MAADDAGAVSAVERFRPAIVVCEQAGYGRNLKRETFAKIRQLGATIVCAIYDTTTIKDEQTLRLFTEADVVLAYDSIFSFVEFSIWSEMAFGGSKRVFYPAGNIKTSVPSGEIPIERDVAFIGSRTGIRGEFLARLGEKLERAGVQIAKVGGIVQPPTEGRSERLPLSDYFRALKATKIVLNLQNELFRDQIKGRIYEGLAAGALCLTDKNDDVDLIFPAGTLETFISVDDCAEKILALLADEPRRASIAEAGKRWFDATFDHRAYWSAVIKSVVGEEVVIPELPVLGQELDRTREAISLVEPQFLSMIRLARTLSLRGLTSRHSAPFLTVGSIRSTHPSIAGSVDDTTLGVGLFEGVNGERGAVLAGWGLTLGEWR